MAEADAPDRSRGSRYPPAVGMAATAAVPRGWKDPSHTKMTRKKMEYRKGSWPPNQLWMVIRVIDIGTRTRDTEAGHLCHGHHRMMRPRATAAAPTVKTAPAWNPFGVGNTTLPMVTNPAAMNRSA